MRVINSTNWLKTDINVDWTEQVDKDGFTEFRYTCKCGRRHFDVYLTHQSNGDNYPVSKKRKICCDCKKTNVVPCRLTRQ